jgi:hypothetical protein
MRISTKELKSAFLNNYPIDHWSNPTAVSLTFKEAFHNGQGWVRISRYNCAPNLRHFLNSLNRNCFGPRWRKHGRGVDVIPVLEQNASGRFHYHLAINRPEVLSNNEFDALVRVFWLRTHWGHREIDCGPADSGWLYYVAKEYSKATYDLSFDWENFHYTPRVV